jgi:predicted negative regulator of RcsB-dependent stress response
VPNKTTDTTTQTSPKNLKHPSQDPHAPIPGVAPGLETPMHFIEEHAKILGALVVILVIGSLGYTVFNFVRSYQEKSAQEAFYTVEATYSKIKQGFDRAKYQKLMPNTKENSADTSKVATGQLDQDYGSVIGELEKVAREHKGTAGGAEAALIAGQIYLEYKQPEKAIALHEATAKSLGSDKVLGGLVKIQWGSAMAAKGDCQAAIDVWQQVLGNKNVSYLHADAALRSGLCFESLNQDEKAMEMYRKASAEGGEQSPTAHTAKSFLRALEVKAKAQPAPQKQG